MNALNFFWNFCLLLAFIVLSFNLWGQNYVLEFNGLGDHIQLDDNIGDGVRSMELWFNINHDFDETSETPRSLFIRNSDDEFGEFGLCLSAFPEYRGNLLFFKREGHEFFYAISDTSRWERNTWYHVAGTVDPAEGMKLYINGVLQQKTDVSTTPTDIRSEIVAIGKWGDWDTRYFNGKIDEVRVWNRSLSQEEIIANMCTISNPEEEIGLKAYWRFNDMLGNIVPDSSGNANHGLLIGATYDEDDNCTLNTAEELESQDWFSVFPNPASTYLTFQFESSTLPERVIIYDPTGKMLIKKESLMESRLNFDLTNFSAGIYFYSIVWKNQKVSGKVILN